MTKVIEVVRRGRRGADGASGVVSVLRTSTPITLSSNNRGFVIIADAAVTITIPVASALGAGWSAILDADGGAMTVASASNINGSSSNLTVPQGYSVQIYTDGAEYLVQFFINEAVAFVNSNGVANESGIPGATLTAALDGLAVVAVSGAYSDLSGTPAFVPELTQTQAEDPASTVFGAVSGLRLAQAVQAEQARVGWTNIAPVATTSGTEFNVASIPDGIAELELYLQGVSLSGIENFLVQIGTGASPTLTGYVGSTAVAGSAVGAGYTNGFGIWVNTAGRLISGRMKFTREPGANRWHQEHAMYLQDAFATVGAGIVTLSGNLNNFRLTQTGADTFDAGSFWGRYR